MSKRENLNSRLPLTSSCLTLNLWASSVAATLVCAALTSSALASLNCRDVFADPSLLNQRVQLIQVGSLFAKIDRVTPDGSIQLSDGVDRFAVIGFKDGAPVMKKIVVPHSHDVSLGKSEILQAHELILRGQTMTWFAKDDIGNQTLHVYTDLSNSENFPESPSHAVRGLSVDGRFVVSSDGKSLRVFDTKERSVATEKRGLIGLLKSLSSSEVIGAQIKDDGTVISWYENGELRIYDKSLNFIAKENLKNENGEPLTKLDWIIESPDQKQVVIGAKGRVALYDLETKQISSLPADKTWASHVRWFKDSVLIESRGEQNTALVFARDFSSTRASLATPTRAISLSPFQGTIDRESRVQILNLETGKTQSLELPEDLLKVVSEATPAAVSDDGRVLALLVSRGSDLSIQLVVVDTKTMAVISESATGLNGRSSAAGSAGSSATVLFGPESRSIVVGGKLPGEKAATLVYKIKSI